MVDRSDQGQPFDYLDAVWNDTVRIVLPNHHSFGDLSADENIAFMLGGPDLKSGANDFVKYWQDRYYPHEEHHQGSMTWLRDYEVLTRVEGGWMLLLLALRRGCAVGGASARSRGRLPARAHGVRVAVVPDRDEGLRLPFRDADARPAVRRRRARGLGHCAQSSRP